MRLPTRADKYWAKAPFAAVVKNVSTLASAKDPIWNELRGPYLTSDAPEEPTTLVYAPANQGGCRLVFALTNGPLKTSAREAPVSAMQVASAPAILHAVSGFVSSNRSGTEISAA